MNDLLQILDNSILFNGLPQEQLEQIAGIAVDRHCRRGESIFSEGDDCNGFYVAVSGSVKIFKASSEGKEQILHIFGPGEPFGEVPVFTEQPFPANAEAISSCRLLFFPKPRFVGLITRNPSVSLNMLAVLCVRLRQFTVQIENLSLKEVPGRLAAYLLYLAEEQDSETVVELKIAKGQLASLLGTIPETLSRVFSRMTDRNLIQVSGRKIQLLNPMELQDLADNGKSID
jgi:CRP/FNR family transcriptional regulator, dissimilatory nitrate respiration regulator